MCRDALQFDEVPKASLRHREGAPPLREALDPLAASDRAPSFYWFYTAVFHVKFLISV